MRPRSLTFDAIGTHWQIDCQAESSDGEWLQVMDSVRSRIDLFDRTYSRFRQDSLVMELARSGGTVEFPPDSQALFSTYEVLYQLTNGAFTPLIGNLISDSGYDADYSLKPKELRTPRRWEDVLRFEYPHVTLLQDEILDFGAGGKGYLIDIVAKLLESFEIHTYCVDAGGDIVQRSERDSKTLVGLEHPLDTSLAIGVASICNQSIAGSSGNRRSWGKYHHIFDPKTNDSTRDVLATWVVASTGLVADALATCLFLVDPATLRSFTFEYLMLYPDFSMKKSDAFPAEIFVQKTL